MDVVTGATGLLGNSLVRELLKQKRKVKILARKTSNLLCFKDCYEDIKVHFGDILDYNSLRDLFKDADHVYHLASEYSILPGKNKNLEKINLRGTENVIKACIENKVKRLIYTSSIHIFKEPKLSFKKPVNGFNLNDEFKNINNSNNKSYKNFNYALNKNYSNFFINENLEIDINHPLGIYNRTKAIATLKVLNSVKAGLNAVIVCPTAIIGPYDYKPSNLGSLVLNYLKKKQKLIIDGAYDFVDARDAAIGHILAANKGKSGEIYILSGERLEIPTLIKILSDVSGIKYNVYKLPYWLIYPLSYLTPIYYKITKSKPLFTTYSIKTIRSNSFISCNKAVNDLGYKARPIRETLKDIIDWIKSNQF